MHMRESKKISSNLSKDTIFTGSRVLLKAVRLKRTVWFKYKLDLEFVKTYA